ncbi:hypothetical protein K0M31_002390 [Melipona bicolor]|uniref:BAH domain-containing protein n=1 Tax=Melipona bicolor TaxID=60889 RepID=A0AA40GHG2_9HYME|nr:hypothetical protein K0M31_002390 [Melipona bicolor]
MSRKRSPAGFLARSPRTVEPSRDCTRPCRKICPPHRPPCAGRLALNYTLLDLSAQVAELKRVKQRQELSLPNEDESCDGSETKDSETNTNTEGSNSDNGGSMSFNQEHLGNSLTRNYLGSDAHVAVPLAKVAGRCCVLSVKDYFRMQSDGFLEKDVYVCESRYSTKARAFKKIKVWNFDPDHLKLIPREKPLEPKRVISVYKERLEKHKEEIAELEEGEKLTGLVGRIRF